MVSYLKNYYSKLQRPNKGAYYILIGFFLMTLVGLFRGNITIHSYGLFFQNKIIVGFLFLFFMFLIIQHFLLLKKSYFLYLVRLLFIILILLEFVFGYYNHKIKHNDEVLQNFKKNSVYDPVVGFKLIPNLKAAKQTKTVNGDLVYNVVYSSDAYSRRIDTNHVFKNVENKTKHALFLGGSFTFGEGLDYRSTFPNLFENKNKNYYSYNYGFRAYGPHQIAFLFENGLNVINNSSIPEEEGICVYSHILDHLNRVYGGSVYLAYGHETPDVHVSKEGEITAHKRSFIQRKLSLIIKYSETLKYFNINFWYPKKTSFYKRFANIVNAIATKYWNLKPKGKFIVAIYPEQINDLKWLQYLDAKIEVIKVPLPADYNEKNKGRYFMKNDGHPTREMNLHFTNELSLFLNDKD